MYEKNSRGWLKHLDFIMLDLLSLSVSYWLSFYLRQSIGQGLRQDISYRTFYLILAGMYVLIVFFSRGYSDIVRRDYVEEIRKTVKQNVLMFVCTLIYLVFTKQSQFYSRLLIGGIFVLNFFVTILLRFLLKQAVRSKLSKQEKKDSMLMITTKDRAKKSLNDLMELEYLPFSVTGIVLLDDEDSTESSIGGIPVVANRDSMMEYIRTNVVDQVVVSVGGDKKKIGMLAEELLDVGIVVHIGIGQELEFLPHKQFHKLGNLFVITSSIQTASRIELFLKRLIDICGALVGLVMTAILIIFVGPIIYIKSPGPIFFTQYRVGKNGRKFKLYKLRSMYMDAEERKKELMKQNNVKDGMMFKMDDDPRIIKGVGHFIRKTSLDEFPQFWNILKGDMSIVGPRPERVEHVEKYSREIPEFIYREKVKGGLTGYAQIYGRYNTSAYDKLRLDLMYIEDYSLVLDIKMIFRTIRILFQKDSTEGFDKAEELEQLKEDEVEKIRKALDDDE